MNSVVPRGGAAPWVECVVAFSGPCGEEKHRPLRDWGGARAWGGDMVKAIKVLPEAADRSAAMAAASALVERHWAAIERVARALQERGELSGREVDALL